MSGDNRTLERRKELIAKIRPVRFPGVNGQAICDCGCAIFAVGVGADAAGNNHIHCLQCSECGHQLAVPFFHDGAKSASEKQPWALGDSPLGTERT